MDELFVLTIDASVTAVMRVIFGLLLAYPLMILWNEIVPAVFGLKAITYWNAFGLYILAILLFNSPS
jgi:hypothetical protein